MSHLNNTNSMVMGRAEGTTDPVESKEHESRLASEADAGEATPVTCVPLAAMVFSCIK